MSTLAVTLRRRHAIIVPRKLREDAGSRSEELELSWNGVASGYFLNAQALPPGIGVCRTSGKDLRGRCEITHRDSFFRLTVAAAGISDLLSKFEGTHRKPNGAAALPTRGRRK